jgi:transcriptional regulator with XRE-family HTH domain
VADGVEQRLRDLGDFIREQRESARLSLRGLSDRAGISNPYLSQIERGLRKPSADILQQIARGLAISAETLYVRAGILDPRDDNGAPPTDLEHAIGAAPDLDDRQKQVLIDLYRTMRRPDEGVHPGH